MKAPGTPRRKRFAVRELDAGEGATDALRWVEQELMNIDGVISEALRLPSKP